jgi:hypothetical protein
VSKLKRLSILEWMEYANVLKANLTLTTE